MLVWIENRGSTSEEKIGGLEYTAIELWNSVWRLWKKSECIISELEDNFEWTITCVTGIKKKNTSGQEAEGKNRLEEIMAEMFPVWWKL